VYRLFILWGFLNLCATLSYAYADNYLSVELGDNGDGAGLAFAVSSEGHLAFSFYNEETKTLKYAEFTEEGQE
jgi:hypothetical protein